METLLPIIALIALALCAIPFGTDSCADGGDNRHDWS